MTAASDAIVIPKTAVHFTAIGLVLFVAAIFQFGYPLLILLADFAAVAAVAAIVALTALDLVAQKKTRRATRAETEAAARPLDR